jgi:tetratricopeptide (TPR) repeat protein
MQRLQAEQEAIRQRMLEDQNRRGGDVPVNQALADAIRAYDSGRYAEAAASFDNFMVNVQPDANTIEHYDALCGFVRAMHRRGYRYAIRTRALQAVSYGPNSTNFEEMFSILSDVANDAQYLDPQFETFADYTVGGFDQEFQDEFNFFMGRFFWAYNDVNRAIGFFERLDDASPDRAKAHYLAGALLLNEQRNREALQELQSAVQASEVSGNTDVYELANLALARVSYELGIFDNALYHYQKVEEDSFRHPRARFETMWTFFMKQDWNRAIGAIHSLNSPYYDMWFWPDLHVVEAAAYLQTCNLELAERAVAEFDAWVDPVKAQVEQFIVNTSSPQEYWTAVMNHHEDAQRAGSGLPLEAVRYVFSQAEFIDKLELLGQLELESNLLSDDSGALGNWGSTASTLLQSDVMTKEIEAGLAVTAMIRTFNNELTEWDVKGQEVAFEVTREIVRRIDATLEGGAAGEGASSVFVLGADWQLWPFEGEYWIDEVDNFRGDITNFRDQRSGSCLNPDTAMAPTE